MFDFGFNPMPIQVVNQTDRIQGMARYMNDAGSSTELWSLLIILVGMVTVVLLLRAIYRKGEQKRAQARQALKAKRETETRSSAVARPTRRRQRR